MATSIYRHCVLDAESHSFIFRRLRVKPAMTNKSGIRKNLHLFNILKYNTRGLLT